VGITLVAVLLVVPSFWAYAQIRGASRIRAHTHEVIIHANAVMSALNEAETGQRGFAMTGEAIYLEPYLKAREGMQASLDELRKLTEIPNAQRHLDALFPLVDAKLAEMARVIDQRKSQGMKAGLAAVKTGKGRHLMDEVRAELTAFLQIENDALAKRDADFQRDMGNLFVVIVIIGLFTLLGALVFIDGLRRQAAQRLKNQAHQETKNQLELQEKHSASLQNVNASLLESEEKLAVTLNSIGDAVIATDGMAVVRLMNPVAEQLTGWTFADAKGRSIDDVFRIMSEETRKPTLAPIMATLEHGTVQGLANHTLLIARDGTEIPIADSCAPIRDHGGQVIGAVLVFRNVSKENAAQQSLRDSLALIDAVLQSVGDGIITIKAKGGLIEKINPAAERMFGYDASELVSQSLSALIPKLDPDQIEGSLESFQASYQSLTGERDLETAGRRKDGQLFPLEMTTTEMSLGGHRYFTGILRDLTSRREAEAALLKAGALQNAIFNSANFSSIATDANGVIQIFNVGAERMLGYAATDVMNKITPADISDPTELVARARALSLGAGTPIKPGFEALVFKATRGIEDIYELTYIRKDGSRLPAVVSVTALRDAKNAIIGYLLIGTDNTVRQVIEAERTRLDMALQERNVELQSAKVTADKANLAKSDFLSSMSHELRSPLNAILGFAQLMDSATPPPTEEQKVSIDRILHAGWYLLELINEILDLAVIESGKLSISAEPVSLEEVMIDCRFIIEPQCQKRGITLAIPAFPSPIYVRADRVRLKQVLINLLSNAVKYNRPHGTVEVVCSVATPGRIRITVKDTGQGLSPDQIRQLFQPFNRLGQERSMVEGTGIGLVMSKLLVELMGGDIGVHSTVGIGSEFWYDLKTENAPMLKGAPGIEAIDIAAVGSRSGAVRTILYVEDNPANLELVSKLIGRRPDLCLLGAEDATIGLRLAREKHPEVILMDINLPGMSGIQAMKLLREDPSTEHIPVIALSANAMTGDIKKGLDEGFFRYITKPIVVSVLMQTIDEALEFEGNATLGSK
jgi:PAS domain S-box-containing protein